MTQPIIIIGGGNMGGAMATRWPSANIHIVEQNADRRRELSNRGITCHPSLATAPRGGIYLLAIKPQQFAELAVELTAALRDTRPLLISIMAGIALAEIEKISPRAVRVMPNLPATIGESMSVLCAPKLDQQSRADAAALFEHIGAVAWVEDETQLHAVTAISGSGPAYLFALMEALHIAAITHGLDAKLAQQLITQTMRGAALLADESTDDAATLRAQVTSKGGTTEAALQAFTAGDLNGVVQAAVSAAIARSEALAKS